MFWMFVQPDQLGPDSVEITGKKAHHLARVLRVRPGERGVAVCDGIEYHVRVSTVQPDRVTGHVEESRPSSTEPPVRLTLLQAILPNPDFDAVIADGTAAGVSRFLPVLAARSVARPDAARLYRWRAIAESAAEQSHRGRVPDVGAMLPLQDAIREADGARLLVLHPGAGTPLRAAVLRGQPHALAVGPEGGWTDAELATLTQAGGAAVSLGPRILRARLAPVIAAAILIDQA